VAFSWFLIDTELRYTVIHTSDLLNPTYTDASEHRILYVWKHLWFVTQRYWIRNGLGSPGFGSQYGQAIFLFKACRPT